MKNLTNTPKTSNVVSMFLIALSVVTALHSKNATAKPVDIPADVKEESSLPGFINMSSALGAANFVAGAFVKATFGEQCKQDEKNVGCQIFSLIGWIKAEDTFQDDVKNSLNEINGKLDIIDTKLIDVETTQQKHTKKLNDIHTDVRQIVNLAGESKIMANVNAELTEFKNLHKHGLPKKAYFNWAVGVIGNQTDGKLSKDLTKLVEHLAGPSSTGTNMISIYADRMYDSYTSKANYDYEKNGHQPRKGEQTLLYHYNNFQSFTLGKLLAIKKVENLYSLASGIYDAVCNNPKTQNKPAECTASSPRWTGKVFHQIAEANERVILREFNRQLDRFVLRVSTPDATYHWYDIQTSTPGSLSKRADFTNLTPYEEAKSVDLMFTYADIFTSMALDEWGLRGRVISAGNKFITSGSSSENKYVTKANGEKGVLGGLCIITATKGASPRIDERNCKLISPKPFVPPDPLKPNAAVEEPFSGLPKTDYWSASKPDPDITRPNVYDTVYFGKWVVYHYYEPENSANIKGMFPPKANENLFLYTKLPYGTGVIPALVVNNRHLGSFFGIERAGGSYAMLSGAWTSSKVREPLYTTYVSMQYRKKPEPVQFPYSDYKLGNDPVSYGEDLANLRLKINTNGQIFPMAGGHLRTGGPDSVAKRTLNTYVTIKSSIRLTNNKVIYLPENQAVDLVSEYYLPTVNAGGSFWQHTDDKASVSAGVGVFFNGSQWDAPAHLTVVQKPAPNTTVQTGPEALMKYDGNSPYKQVAKGVALFDKDKYRYKGQVDKATLQNGKIEFRAYVDVSVFVGLPKTFSSPVWTNPSFQASADGQLLNLFVLSQ